MTEHVEVTNVKTLTDKVVELGRETLYMSLGVVDVVPHTYDGIAFAFVVFHPQ